MAAARQAVVDAAVALIDGCDHAAIGVLDRGRFRSAASSDDVIRHIDELQNRLGEGPCLESSTDGIARLDNDITRHSTWPRLAAAVVEQTPVRAMLAVPLIDEGQRRGALNVFGDRPGAFDDEAMSTATILAAFAMVAVAGAQHSERADHLEQGLQTNREIGAAVGILMATHRISQPEAFAMLSGASQRLNRKLREIATAIVRGDEGPRGSR